MDRAEQIAWCVIDTMNDQGRVPAIEEIVVQTGLSKTDVSQIVSRTPSLKELFSCDDEETEQVVKLVREGDPFPDVLLAIVVGAKMEVMTERLKSSFK